MPSETFDLSDIRFVKRIIIGNDQLNAMKSEEEIAAATVLLNRCLTDTPRGRIIGTEKGFGIFNIGEHQVVLQHVVYHVGWPRKPAWLEG